MRLADFFEAGLDALEPTRDSRAGSSATTKFEMSKLKVSTATWGGLPGNPRSTVPRYHPITITIHYHPITTKLPPDYHPLPSITTQLPSKC
jgi:hypothetical protein